MSGASGAALATILASALGPDPALCSPQAKAPRAMRASRLIVRAEVVSCAALLADDS